MAVSYKGLVIKFGGDTTELQGALRDVQKQSRETQSDLKDINKALKFDPGNTELLQQKVKALNGAYDETKRKLDAYQRALSGLEAKKRSGEKLTEQEERQYDSLKRAIMQCERQLESYSDELADTEKEAEASRTALYKFGQAIEDSAGKLSGAGSKMETAGKALSGGVIGVAGSLTALAESQEEAIQQNAQLETAFTNAGSTAEQSSKVYGDFYRLLGDGDTATEAAQNLIRLTQNEQELSQWADIAAGAYATFGNALPLENLAEAAQETAHTGTVTGGLADAINWATASNEQWQSALSGNSDAQAAFNKALGEGATKEDAFNAALAACKTEQERSTLITQALTGIYGDAGKQFQDTNKDLLASRDAQNELETSMRELGEAALPVKQTVTEIGTEIMQKLAPALQAASDWYKNLTPEQQGLVKSLALGALAFGGVTAAVGKTMQAAAGIGGTIKALASGIKGLSGGIGGLIGKLGGIGGAWKIFTGLISANPIGLGIAAVSAAIAGLTWFFTQTETGKQMWADFTGWIAEKWQAVCDFFDGAGDFFGSAWESVTTGVETFKSDVAAKWEGFKTDAGNAWESIKGTVSEKAQSAADWAADRWNTLKANTATAFSAVESTVVSVADCIGEKLGFPGLGEKVSEIFNNIRSFMENPIKSAWDFISGIPDRIMSAFSGIRIELPGIKMPHFNVTWNDIGGVVKLPSISVDWYARGGYFDRASIIGVGEAGGEYVAPERQLWDFIERAVSNAFGSGQPTQQIAVSVEVNATVANGMDAYQTGRQIGQGITSKLKQRGVNIAP